MMPLLVGRTKEFQPLHGALNQVRIGLGSCVVVLSEAGVGKSCLLPAFRRQKIEGRQTIE